MTPDLWQIPTPGARLAAALDAGLVVRGNWRSTAADGREMACTLAWLSRDVYDRQSADACPADLMPDWAAEMIPWMDDAGSAEAWPAQQRRLALLIDRASPATWSRRLQARWLLICVDEARSHCRLRATAALAAIDEVRALLARAIAGDEPSRAQWDVATNAAAKWPAAMDAGAAMWAAGGAAEIAVKAAAEEAVKAATVAPVSPAAAADRMINAMLDALEDEIETAQKAP